MDYGIRDHMEHSLQINLTKEGTNLLTIAGGKFGLWKMAEKSELSAEGGSMEAITLFTASARTSLSSTLV